MSTGAWKFTKERLERRLANRLEKISKFLDEDTDFFSEKIRESRFKDIVLAEAILIDKWLLMNNEPTQIISHEERKNLHELLPAIAKELEKRGFTATLEQRTASLTVPPASISAAPPLAVEGPR